MSQHPFRILNVFTRPGDRLSGNPLAVFEPSGITDSLLMQKLARQMNLSETTFLAPSGKANARVRIFTPAYEMPFAGHPTLGSAHVARALGLGKDELVLEMEAGLIPVRAGGKEKADRWTLQAQTPTWREPEQTRPELARLVGLAETDVAERPLWVNAGREQLILPLKTEAAVRRAQPSREVFARLETNAGPRQVFVFAETGPGEILSRFFFPNGPAVLEDPATGSAHANLGGWWLAMGRPLPARLVSSQGEYAARPSLLSLEVDAEQRVFVSGDVLELARGVLEL